MEQTYDLKDIEIVLSNILDDMELKQILKIFKNYKKDEKVLIKTEDDIVIPNKWFIRGSKEFSNILGKYSKLFWQDGLQLDNAYYDLKRTTYLPEYFYSFQVSTTSQVLEKEYKEISAELFETHILPNLIKEYENTNVEEDKLPF